MNKNESTINQTFQSTPKEVKFVNEWTAEWMANAKEPLKQPKTSSRLLWFFFGLIIGAFGMMVYMIFLMRI